MRFLRFFSRLAFFVIALSAALSESVQAAPTEQRVFSQQGIFHFNQTLFRRLHFLAESIGYGRGDRFVMSETDSIFLGQRPERLIRFKRKAKMDAFIEGFGFLNSRRTTNSSNAEGDLTGLILGLDRIVSPNLIVGFSGSGFFSEARSNAPTIYSDSFLGSVYGIWGENDKSIAATIGFESNQTDFSNSAITGNAFFISTEYSRKMRLVCGDLTPLLGFDFHFNKDGQADKNKWETFTQVLGFRFSRRIAFGKIVFDPELKLGWLHDYSRTEIDKDRILLGVNVIGCQQQKRSVSVNYSTEQGFRYQSHRIAACFGFSF